MYAGGKIISTIFLAKSGAIISSIGVALLVIFVVILLTFPVIKNCGGDQKCSYHSTAPGQLQLIVQPSFLAVSLFTISVGILILRLSRWLESKRSEERRV